MTIRYYTIFSGWVCYPSLDPDFNLDSAVWIYRGKSLEYVLSCFADWPSVTILPY
jgi:hypothetical protein